MNVSLFGGILYDWAPITLLLYYHFRNFSQSGPTLEEKEKVNQARQLSGYFLSSEQESDDVQDQRQQSNDAYERLYLRVRKNSNAFSEESHQDLWQNSDVPNSTERSSPSSKKNSYDQENRLT